YEELYHGLWDDLADWYIEASKINLNPGVLAFSLDTILRLAHPFAPFVTETIWQTLKWEGDSLLITAPWPQVKGADGKKGAEFDQIKALVSEIRYIKGVMHLRSGIKLYHAGEAFLRDHSEIIKKLARIDDIQEVRDGHGLHLTSVPFSCWLDIDQETARRFLEQLKLKLAEQKKLVEQLQARLNNKSYVQNAPKELVEETEAQLEAAKALGAKIAEEYTRFSGSSS
ncbi:MAG TPA: class I tRNA ligase family protein, partial [Patescibacteria group bacterium]|nr:class I tRNA ligase family protein [Patescibacteria group bacterium]